MGRRGEGAPEARKVKGRAKEAAREGEANGGGGGIPVRQAMTSPFSLHFRQCSLPFVPTPPSTRRGGRDDAGQKMISCSRRALFMV